MAAGQPYRNHDISDRIGGQAVLGTQLSPSFQKPYLDACCCGVDVVPAGLSQPSLQQLVRESSNEVEEI
jgi:hypothetical protein